jgi:predicted DNA-binding transcriptional regulator AlpA
MASTDVKAGENSGSGAWLSVEDLAARWKRPAKVVYGLRYRGEAPPAIRIGRELRFRLSDVVAWEDARLAAAADGD